MMKEVLDIITTWPGWLIVIPVGIVFGIVLFCIIRVILGLKDKKKKEKDKMERSNGNLGEHFRHLKDLPERSRQQAREEALAYLREIKRVNSRIERICGEFARHTGSKLQHWANWQDDIRVRIESDYQGNCYTLTHPSARIKIDAGYHPLVEINIYINPPMVRVFLHNLKKQAEIPISTFSEEQLARILKEYWEAIAADPRIEY